MPKIGGEQYRVTKLNQTYAPCPPRLRLANVDFVEQPCLLKGPLGVQLGVVAAMRSAGYVIVRTANSLTTTDEC